jgi:ATP-dependent Lhr-like helicase
MDDIDFLRLLPTIDDSLGWLGPAVADWFRASFGVPTSVQRAGFATVSRGESVLLSAPTGTGKTLAAMLPLIARTPTAPGLAGLVITPLKALAVDQVKNLTPVFAAVAPALRFGIRTGDTSAKHRRQLKDEPPHVLWTTPESLAVLLTQDVFRQQVESLRWVVIDEIHALAASKRGSDLALSLERLEELTQCGRLQRVGLSATCEPIADVARFLVGTGRGCCIVDVPPPPETFELSIEPLSPGGEIVSGFAARVVERLLRELESNRTTLVFANTRNTCERIGWALKRRLPTRADNIAIHHSSLAAERRREIEADLKAGKLAVVISSASLELGIDIGSVDGVVFVHPPGGVSRLLQRLGRSGHRPGGAKRGVLLCGHAGELLEAGVTAASGRSRQIEPVAIPQHPLDVLCQHLLGMSIGRAWRPDEAFALVCRAFPYRDLCRDDFDACVRYLRGLNADESTWLPARLDELDGRLTITSRKTARLVVRNLGTIVAEEPRRVIVEGSDSFVVGELDDDYAGRLQPGDRFVLDGRCLTLVRANAREIVVRESPGTPLIPSWGSAGLRMSEQLARRVFRLRAEAAEALRDGSVALAGFLKSELGLGDLAALDVADLLHEQEAVSEIPHEGGTLIEVVDRGFSFEYAIHTPLHAAANEAIARAAQQRLRRRFGGKVSIAAVTLGVVLVHDIDVPLGDDGWRLMLSPDGIAEEVDAIVRDCDLTRSRFAAVAQTGMMVLRQPLGGRRKVGGRDWIERRLFDQLTAVDDDFALLTQARRETAATACDGAAALRYLRQIATLPLTVRPLADVSPIAAAWLDAGEEAAHKQWHVAG